MEKTDRIKQIVNKEDLDQMLKLAKTIIYISVNWSGQERMSRHVVNQVFDDLNVDEIPVFEIDCLGKENKYVKDWINSQSSSIQRSYLNGYGETLLVNYGKVINHIKYPGELGIEKTKMKIKRWLHEK